MSDDLARQLRGIGMPVCNKAADALEAKDREIERLRTAEAEAMAVVLSLEGTVERLRAENESLKRDAECFRWLRRLDHFAKVDGMLDTVEFSTLDAAIDAAMSQQEPKS